MSKQSLFYGLIFLVLASLGQEAVAMKGFGQKASNYFRLGMKTLNYAGVIGYSAYELNNDKKKVRDQQFIENKFDEATEKEVLNLLRNAYPELKDRQIHIVHQNEIKWWTTQFNGTDYLFMGCIANELNKATHLKTSNTQRLSTATLALESKKHNLSVAEYITAFELLKGIAMTPSTIDLWSGMLVHEGSHIANNDSQNRHNFKCVMTTVVLVGSEITKKVLNLDTLLKAPTITNNILKGLACIPSTPLKIACVLLLVMPLEYWAEYRADQDAIKHTKDPAILSANSNALRTIWPDTRAHETR